MPQDPADARAEYIAGLRAFIDLLESDPTIPTPSTGLAGTGISAHLHANSGLTQDERFELIHDFADAHQVPVVADHTGMRKAEKRFGPVTFHVYAFADAKPEPVTVTRPSTHRTEPAHA